MLRSETENAVAFSSPFYLSFFISFFSPVTFGNRAISIVTRVLKKKKEQGRSDRGDNLAGEIKHSPERLRGLIRREIAEYKETCFDLERKSRRNA